MKRRFLILIFFLILIAAPARSGTYHAPLDAPSLSVITGDR